MNNDSEKLMPKDGWLREYIDLFTPQSEAPAESHLATALAVLSTAIGWRAYIRWGRSAEPSNLFVILEGGSATAKKTTTMRTGSDLIRLAMSTQPEGVLLPMQVHPVSHTSRKGLLELVAAPDNDTAKAWEKMPPPGVLFDWDEFGAVLGRPGDVKGQDYLGQVRATLMELYGGRHGGIQTGAVKIRGSRASVSVLATMTRVELEQRVSTGLLRDGFLGRFILVPHPGRRAYMAQPPPSHPDDDRRREALARFLRRVSLSSQEIGSAFDRMTNDARDIREEWYERRMRQMDERAESGTEADQALSDALGRLQTAAMKVAIVGCVSRMEEDEDLGSLRIDDHDVQFGINFAEYALAEVGRLASEGGAMPTDRFAERVVQWLRKKGKGYVAARSELLDALRQDGLDSKARWAVVEELMRSGVLVIDVQTGTGGRARQDVWLTGA